jgi:hypothetical protein
MTGGAMARLLTAGGLIAVGAWAAAQGWSVVAFATARSEEGVAPTRAWVGSPVAGAILDRRLDQLAAATEDAPHQRLELLSQRLAVRPLSSAAWLSLAGMRAVTGGAYGEMLAALKMSAVTGPNEARIMWQRGLFSVLQWEMLPVEFRIQAARDLAGPLAAGLIDDADANLAARLVQAKPTESRGQIASMLAAQSLAAVALQRIGLENVP